MPWTAGGCAGRRRRGQRGHGRRGATSLGGHFGVPEIIIGGLVLAAVTSLPNVVLLIHLARRGRGAATLSTALNSNSLNVTAGLLDSRHRDRPRPIQGNSGLLVAGWYVGLTALTLVLAYAGHGLRRTGGGLIIAAAPPLWSSCSPSPDPVQG